MSSNTYTMKLLIDDSAIKKLEDRLNNITTGGGVGSSIGGVAGGGENPAKQLGKLGAIAAGIASLVVMVKTIVEKMVVASPALQSMLKLLDVSIMLILRPIGDFFAFLLKPILIFFLQKVAIPFYRILDSPMIKAGEQAGNRITNNLENMKVGTSIGGMIAGPVGALIGGELERLAKTIANRVEAWWAATFPNFDETFANIVGFFESLNIPTLEEIWAGFENWFIGLNIPSLDEIWAGFESFFAGLDIPSLNEIWTGFRSFFGNLQIPTLEEIWLGVRSFFSFLDIPDWMVEAYYHFQSFIGSLKIPQWVMDIVNGFFEFLKAIGKWLEGIPDFFKDLLGIGGGNTASGNSPAPPPLDLNVHIDGAVQAIGQGADDVKTQILGWFNEWLK